MNEQSGRNASEIARAYYNSSDADSFYIHIWGGEDIHVGLYQSDDESIAAASHRTVEHMAKHAGTLTSKTRVLDLGSGYGASMRYLAREFGCQCVALNYSDVENNRARQMNEEVGLSDRIDVVDGDFTALEFDDESFDLVWSQEAILHSGDREKVCSEAARVLRPGGQVVFTDPMQSDTADPSHLQPVYERLQLDSLASPSFYRQIFKAVGLREVIFEEHASQLTRHYARVRTELIKRAEELRGVGVSDDYIERMKTGLQHWVDAGRSGELTWGIFVFEKPV